MNLSRFDSRYDKPEKEEKFGKEVSSTNFNFTYLLPEKHHLSLAHDEMVSPNNTVPKTDYYYLIKRLSYYSSKSFEEIRDLDFEEKITLISNPKKDILEVLEILIKKKLNNYSTIPTIGEFRLYTSKEMKDKAPRIFFCLLNGVVHPFIYDPNHNIFLDSTKKKSKKGTKYA